MNMNKSSVQSIVENHAKNVFEFMETDKEKLKGRDVRVFL